MDVKITLALGRGELVVGESTSLKISITNASSAPLSVPDPINDRGRLKLRVYDLASKHSIVLGSNQLAQQTSHEFVPQLPQVTVQLAPGQQAHRDDDLLPWVGTLAPGQYDISALLESDDSQLGSEPVRLTVVPLDLVSASTVGSHSGYSPFRYTVWSSRMAKGSVVVLTCFTFDEHGHPKMTMSVRIAEPGHAVEPSGSVTPNKQSYPAQWIVWPEGSNLAAIYVKQGRIESPLKLHPLGGNGSYRVIAPVLVDLTGNDGSTPARGLAALWHAGGGRTELLLRTLDTNGSLAAGPQTSFGSGEYLWGRALALSTGERRVYLAMDRNGDTDLDCVPVGKASKQVSHFTGRLIGASLTLNPRDTIFGAALTRKGPAFQIHTWQEDIAGPVRTSAPVPLMVNGSVAPDHAVISLGPTGKLCVLVGTADKKWFRVDSKGAVRPLPSTLDKFGHPVDAFWLNEVTPMVLIAGPQTGLTYQALDGGN